MKSLPFLACVMLVAAVVAHLSYVLFFPAFTMQRLIGGDMLRTQNGHPAVVEANGNDEVVAMCRFDLDDGNLGIDATMPDGLWSLTVYGADGADLYAVNDRQAGTDRFKLTVKKAPGWLDLLRGGGDSADVNDGWSVEVDTRKGLAVFWAALDDKAMRDSVAKTLVASTCRAEAAES